MNPLSAINWQAKLWELGALAALVLGLCASVWFIADARYSKAYVALKAQYEQASKDAAVEDARVLADYAHAAQEVNDEAQAKLARAAADLADLRVRVNDGYAAIGACSAASADAADVALGPGAADSHRPADAAARPAGPALPAELATIDPGVLRAVLSVGIDALNAELLWRDYARRTGQVSPTPLKGTP